MNKWLLEPRPPCILHGNSLPSITDIYMHKFNTFAHDIQVNHFSNSVTSMPGLTFYYRPSPLMIAPKLFPYKRVWIMVPYRKQSLDSGLCSPWHMAAVPWVTTLLITANIKTMVSLILIVGIIQFIVAKASLLVILSGSRRKLDWN